MERCIKFKNKNLSDWLIKVNISKHFENEASCQLPLLTALSDLLIYTELILAYDQYYFISENHTKINDRLYVYIWVCSVHV